MLCKVPAVIVQGKSGSFYGEERTCSDFASASCLLVRLLQVKGRAGVKRLCRWIFSCILVSSGKKKCDQTEYSLSIALWRLSEQGKDVLEVCDGKHER